MILSRILVSVTLFAMSWTSFGFSAAHTSSAAHWLDAQTIAIKNTDKTRSLHLLYQPNGRHWQQLIDDSDNIARKALTPIEYSLPNHLNGFRAYTLDTRDIDVKTLIQGPVAIEQLDSKGQRIEINQIQLAGVIDHLYTSGSNDADEVSDYGATLSDNHTQFKLWAPLASKVSVELFGKSAQTLPVQKLTMSWDKKSGVWSVSVKKNLTGHYYRYQITQFNPYAGSVTSLSVTDPYSLSLATNSTHSQVISLDDASTQPDGWNSHTAPSLAAPEDAIIYELHVRDFSQGDDSILAKDRGRYSALATNSGRGMAHLQSLLKAGLNHIQLLPVFDIGTINENDSQTINYDWTVGQICAKRTIAPLCSNKGEHTKTLHSYFLQQDTRSHHVAEILEQIRDLDQYNWGYDPYHYTVPEGSYAKDPMGINRIQEFRQMVQHLHNMGFRIIMDVVYNHTHKAGLFGNAVLDKIVPGYYHRRNPISGNIEQSTCCDNTATERTMMGKLMIDSLIVWARDYKIDGFRFDLMGHQPKSLMLKARQIIRDIDPDTYFYGEGWNFGEVANNQRFVQATQKELAGTEIGTFTDRLRDAIRGGAPFDDGNNIRRNQGLANGLGIWPNELTSVEMSEAEYRLSWMQTMVGISGNLKHVKLEDFEGVSVSGQDVPYGGDATGYALDPADTVNYVSKHDNQTLWDNNQYRTPFDASTKQRVRMHNMALAYPLLSQGIPFIHMGSELLRSKSFLRDSYDYGDWFNIVDFGKTTNNYNVGLPPASKDKANWEIISKVLVQNQQKDHVSSKDIEFASNVFSEFLAIRSQSPMLRLQTADDISQAIRFFNTGKNHIRGVMGFEINNHQGKLDQRWQTMVIVFNHNPMSVDVPYSGAQRLQLHPVLKSSIDPEMESVTTSNQGIRVPGLTVTVLVEEL